jgi:hypothetical protein
MGKCLISLKGGNNMKKLLSLFVLATVLLTLGFASATVQPVCATLETTFVSGTITDATNGNALVSGADVTVTCNDVIKHATSDVNGGYEVQYTALECPANSQVSVSATHAGLNGESDTISWYTQNTQVGCLQLIVNVACGNVPLVPEFGAFVGALTILGALGTFFVVRRK